MTKHKAPRVFTKTKTAISNMYIGIQAAKTLKREVVTVRVDELEILLDKLRSAETEYQLRYKGTDRVSGGVPYRSADHAEDYRSEDEEIVARLVTVWEAHSEDS